MLELFATARSRIQPRWSTFTAPSESGLPNWRVMSWFPALATAVVAILVTLKISGTSLGSYWRYFGTGTDPQLLAGTPRFSRSDEWLVNQGWTVSQSQTGYQPHNPTFPGGMDITVAQDIPNTDWSTLFRPQDWGFAFGVDTGIVWQWWIPGLLFIVGAYFLLVSFLPRRPLTSAFVAVAVVLSPLFQWTWGSSVSLPVAWSFLVMAAIRWTTRDSRLGVRLAWAGSVGVLAVTMALTLYLPFIIPCLVVVLAFVVGSIAEWRSSTGLPLRTLAVRSVPLVGAAIGAAAAMVAWAATRTATIAAIGSTVYPGVRTVPSGTLLDKDHLLVGTAGAVFGQSLSDAGSILGSSASVAASVPLFAAFVAPGLLVLVIRTWRREKTIDWLAVATLAAMAFVAVYLLVPGLDVIGKFLLFDKVPAIRFRIMLAVLIPLVFALVVRHVDRQPNRWVSWPAIVAVALVGGSTGWVLISIVRQSPELLAIGPLWPLAAVLFAASVFFVFARNGVWISGVALFALGLIIGGGANPVYSGIVDLNDTESGSAINEVDDAHPGTWLGIGGAEVMGLLMQTGNEGYSGLQTYPPQEMWSQIDPTGRYDDIWNRLAHVRWEWGEGAPVVQLYQADVIVTTFDPCSQFAQENVTYIASTVAPPDDSCLVELKSVHEGATDLTIYEVVPG